MKTLRTLLAAALVATLVPTGSASAGIITDLLGPVHVQPGSVGLPQGFTVWDVESHNGVVYVGGSYLGMPAYYSYSIASGAVGPAGGLQVLPSLNPSNPNGQVRDITAVSGSVVLGGFTTGATGNDVGTTWSASGLVSGHGSLQPTESSIVHNVLSNGAIIGTQSNERPGVGVLSGQLQNLPSVATFGTAQGGTPDGRLIVGADGFGVGVWRSDDPLSLDYQLDNISYQLAPDGSSPAIFRHVFASPDFGEVALSNYLDTNLFVQAVGAWDLQTGGFLGTIGYGELMDAQMFGDTLVLGINDPITGGYLTTLDRPDVSVSLASLFPEEMGLSSVTLARGGLFEGSLGFFALSDGPNGPVFATTSFETNAVPEPSSFVLMTVAGLSLLASRRRRV